MNREHSVDHYNAIKKTAICIVLSMFYFAMLAYPFGVSAEGYVLYKAIIAGAIFFAISIPAWAINLKREFYTAEAQDEAYETMEGMDAVKIGELAMNQQLLTLRDVKEILFCQNGNDGKRFGEIAVQRNYLTRDQLENLLTMKR